MDNKTTFKFNFGESTPNPKNENSKYYSIAEYISFMEGVEGDNASISNNTQLMLTKFRKMYYDSFGWNKVLIPETAQDPAFESSEYIQKLIHSHQVNLPNEDEYDIAHIFAILDASNHNGPFTPIPERIIDSEYWQYIKDIVPVVYDRKMASGWLGDLSEISGEFYLEKALLKMQKQKVVNKWGAYYKTLANIDGMIIAGNKEYDLNADSGKKVSDIFKDYYGIDSQEGLRGKLKSSIYLDFAESIGLEGWNGSNFENSSAWLSEQKNNLQTCTAFYMVKARGLKGVLGEIDQLERKDLEKIDIEEIVQGLKGIVKDQTNKSNYIEFAKFVLSKIDNKELRTDLITLAICFLIWTGNFEKFVVTEKILSSYLGCLCQAIVKTQSQE